MSANIDPSDPLYEPCDFCEVKAGEACLGWCDCRACKEASAKQGDWQEVSRIIVPAGETRKTCGHGGPCGCPTINLGRDA